MSDTTPTSATEQPAVAGQVERRVRPLPKAGPVCWADAQSILEYKLPAVALRRLPGVLDVGLWTSDQMRVYADAAAAEALEMSPEFTDTSRAALLWVLWHHQGGSSPVGQPIRFALGMGRHDPLSDHQIAEAKRWASLTGSTTAEFHNRELSRPNAKLTGAGPMQED